jgi:hypothetical protein
MIIETVYPEPVAGYRKLLFAEIDAIGKRLLSNCRTDKELQTAKSEYFYQTRALYDELVRIESTAVQHRIVAQ